MKIPLSLRARDMVRSAIRQWIDIEMPIWTVEEERA